MVADIDISYEKYKVVPWKTDTEWMNLHQLIYKHHDYQKALDIITCYMIRCSKLAWALPVTANFLSVKIAQTQQSENTSNNRLIHLSMASCLVQFIGYVIEKRYKNQQKSSMIQIAKSVNIPDWVIEVRHDCSHGVLPSQTILQSCLDECFNWITDNYWTPQFEEYSKTISSRSLTDESRNSLRRLVTGYLQECFSKNSDKNDRKRRHDVITDMKKLHGRYILDVILQWMKNQILSRQKEDNLEFINLYFNQLDTFFTMDQQNFINFVQNKIDKQILLDQVFEKQALKPKLDLTRCVPVPTTKVPENFTFSKKLTDSEIVENFSLEIYQ